MAKIGDFWLVGLPKLMIGDSSEDYFESSEDCTAENYKSQVCSKQRSIVIGV